MSQDGPEEQSKPGRPPLRFSCASESDANVSTQRFAELSLSGRRKFSLQPFSFSDVLAATENKCSPDDLEGIEEDRRGLFIDFDETIVNGHWHNEIMNDFTLGIKASEDQFKFLIEKFGLKSPNEMCNLIRDALNNEHHVAVLTASKYIKLVSLALESMGLTQEEIRKIYVKNGPEKNLLIQDVIPPYNRAMQK